ncbi:MAG TPA: dynamin family protein [Dermatophilaceae bacterium]|jgi:GTP-binding protein EngB required for normal cell division
MSPGRARARAAAKNAKAAGAVTGLGEVSAESVQARATALASALESGAGCLPAGGVAQAAAVIAKTVARTSIAGGRTVVALAGATGSGKSSLFNLLAGAEVAQVGARRPTTSQPSAAVWGSEPSSALLDWLMVGTRHLVAETASVAVTVVSESESAGRSGAAPQLQAQHRPESESQPEPEPERQPELESQPQPQLETETAPEAQPQLETEQEPEPLSETQPRLETEPETEPEPSPGSELEGLVLLDLPDFDSQATAHRVEADRVLDLVDVFIWVTDPQKYADARLHEDYIARLSAHDAVTITVLNQADWLTPEALDACRSDLKRLLGADGLVDPEVIATSVRDGLGVDDLRRRMSAVVAGHHAAVRRLDSDVRSAAKVLRVGVADSEPGLDDSADTSLVDALSRAAGIPVILDAVERDFWRESAVSTGWPVTRWARALRPEPLKRLGLGKDQSGISAAISQSDVRSVLGRSSLPPATPAARSAVALATRELGDRAGRPLPQVWTDAVTDAAMPPGEDLGDALDQAVVGTSLRARDPFWWTVFGFLQFVLAMTAAVGLSWLIVLMVLGWLQLSAVATPSLGPLPYPTLLFLGGLLAGFLVSLLTGAMGRVGARRRKALVAGRLRESVEEVARDLLVAPVQEILDRHRMTRQHLDLALSRHRA